jgi:hypothetical protein
VKEQSHKDEMSAALRGDFERLRKRGVSVTLAPAEGKPAAEPSPADEPPDAPDPAEQAAEVRPGLFGRLLGR